MDKEVREHFEELILKAVQSTKQENSGLIGDIKSRLHLMDDKIDNYIKEDIRWKEDAKPVIQMGKNIAGFSIVAKILLGVAVAIGSIYTGFLWFQNHIIKN